jgi:hypothetical protein
VAASNLHALQAALSLPPERLSEVRRRVISRTHHLRSHESGVNPSGRHAKGLSEFPDILSPVILQFGGHIGDASLCVEISLIGRLRHRFLYFAFDKWLYLHSRQGLVMVETF